GGPGSPRPGCDQRPRLRQRHGCGQRSTLPGRGQRPTAMTRVLIDPDGLERTARVLDHAADEYHGLARELHALPSLPGPIGGWVDAERGGVAGGLDAQAGTLRSIAGGLRERAREARMADAVDARDRRGKLPDRLPHWPLRPPPLQRRPAEASSPEDFL